MSFLNTVLQTRPGTPTISRPAPTMGLGGSFIFGAIGAVSTLLITIGLFYILIKLGGFIDAMKEKA